MPAPLITKKPPEVLIRDIECEDYMRPTDTLIAVSSTQITPSGLNATPIGVSGTLIQLQVSGGNAGSAYELSVIATTTLGETLEAVIYVYVE